MQSEYLQRLQGLKNGTFEKAPPKERKPIPRVSEKKKAEGKTLGIRQPIAKRSEKMKAIMTALKPLYTRFLATRNVCEINSEVCTKEATCVHHTKGRGINQILDEEYWKASCYPCNSHVETHDEFARKNGHKVSKHAKK
jgi:hypothetical protein